MSSINLYDNLGSYFTFEYLSECVANDTEPSSSMIDSPASWNSLEKPTYLIYQ